jgi:hypothetical protein
MMRCRDVGRRQPVPGRHRHPGDDRQRLGHLRQCCPLVTRTVVAHAGAVRQIADARGKPDTEDLSTPVPAVDRRHRAGRVGAARPRARGARSAFVPQPARNTSNNDSQSSAPPAAPPQPEGGRERSHGCSVVGQPAARCAGEPAQAAGTSPAICVQRFALQSPD